MPTPQPTRWKGEKCEGTFGLVLVHRNRVCLLEGSECLQTRLGAWLETRIIGAKWAPCCMWEACLDCVLASVLTPPHLLSCSVFPRDSCAPPVVHGRVVKMLLPHLFSPLPSSPPSFPYSLLLACLCPPPQIHPCSCLHPHILVSLFARAVCAQMTAE